MRKNQNYSLDMLLFNFFDAKTTISGHLTIIDTTISSSQN